MTTAEVGSLLDSVCALAPSFRDMSEEFERDHRLPDSVIDALRDCGALRALVPAAYGGVDAHPVEFFDAIEELAASDASVGWVTFITNGTKFISLCRIPDSGLDRILAAGPDTIVAGVTAPRGIAERVTGGYRLRGRWAYASGCLHAAWILAGASVTLDGVPETIGEPAQPHTRHFLLPASEVEILDTWRPIGLRGTGSHDFEVHDVFVPEFMSYTMTDPVRPGFPQMGVNVGAAAATAVGIGRAALETFIGLAGRTRAGLTASGVPLGEQDLVRYRVAEARGLIGSGRAFLREVMNGLQATLDRGEMPSALDRNDLQIGINVGILNASRAVQSLCEVAGGPAIHTGERLERLFRDMQAASNNAANSPTRMVALGQAIIAAQNGS